MADSMEIVVVVKGLVGEEKSESKSPSASPSGFDKLKKMSHPISSILSHNKGESSGAYFGKEVARNVINITTKTASLSVNRYFQLSEDYKGQNYLNNIMANINRAKSLGSSVLNGAESGALVGGAAGAAAGAVISGTFNLLNQSIDYQNRVWNYEVSLNATRSETTFKAKRAGLYDGGRGTEN